MLTLCVMLFTAMGFAQINTNGGFENWTGTTPDGWLGSKTNIGADNVVQVTTGAHAGDYACQLINTASGHKRFSTQAIHVDNGTQYVISFWVKGKGDIRVAMFDGRETGSGYSSYSAYHSINSTSYQLCTDTVEAANTTDAGEFILSIRNTNANNDHLIVDDAIVTALTNEEFVAEPVATITGNMFSTDTYFSSATISLSTPTEGASIYYTLDGTEPTSSSTLYSSPFTITESTTLKAMAELNGNSSSVLTKDITILDLNPLFFENFENNGLDQMTVVNVSGTYAWISNSYGGNHYAYANAYNQGATETWLITPSITPPDADGVTLTFSTAKNYNGPGLQVKYSTNYSGAGDPSAATWTDITSDCALSEGSWNWVESGNVEIAGASPLHIAWVYTSEASSAAGWEVDNIMVSAESAPISEVSTPIISPNEGFYYEPQTVSITCADADAIIRYTTDGTEPTENSTVYSQPFTVNTTTTIMAKAWKTNMNPSFTATATISFPAQVANIAAFKTAASNDPQQIMSDVTFVFRSGRYMFVEDNTAAMLIYDNSTPVITNTYNEGDVIQAGVFGKYTLYQGMVEMVPTHNALEATGTPVTVTPANATITDIKTQYTDVYESKLVQLSNVEFISATKFVQNGDTMAIYNRFNTVTTEITAGDLADVTGFVSYSTNYGYQIYPRGDEDIDIHPVVIMDTVAMPEFDLFKDGEFYRVNITCATEGATIYYTLDGTDPDESSNLFTDLFPLPLTAHYTLKAIAMKEGMVNSAIAVYDYNPSGINSYELRDNLSVFPNPATDVVFIDSKDIALIERVELFNAFGQLIRSVEVGNAKAEISVNELATGTYFAKVFTDKGVATLPMIRK